MTHAPMRQLIDAFVAELPAGAASIIEGVDESDNTYFEVCPRNPGAAKIRALNEDSAEYCLAIGRGTIFDVTVGLAKKGGFSSKVAEEHVLEICRAVAKGKFVEKVSVVLGADLCVYGRIDLSSRVVRLCNGLPLVPWWRTIRYSSY